MWLLWIACAGKSSSTAAEDSAAVVAADSAAEPRGDRCPQGMSPIPPESPQYCIMTYEAQVQEETAVSAEGLMPTSFISWYDAQRSCEGTAVVDENGVSYGTMRLATQQEWMDSGDGVLGDGGTLYPWGDEFASGHCIIPEPNMPILESEQPSGSGPDCKSVFGVDDLIGNLWEWVDYGAEIDLQQWLVDRQNEGFEISFEGDRICLLEGFAMEFIGQWTLRITGSPFDTAELDSSNCVLARSDYPSTVTRELQGYLARDPSGNWTAQKRPLPIVLSLVEGETTAQLRVDPERDGEPIAVKVGGAYYTGANSTLRSMFFGHEPTFDGTIGFRCAADPY